MAKKIKDKHKFENGANHYYRSTDKYGETITTIAYKDGTREALQRWLF